MKHDLLCARVTATREAEKVYYPKGSLINVAKYGKNALGVNRAGWASQVFSHFHNILDSGSSSGIDGRVVIHWRDERRGPAHLRSRRARAGTAAQLRPEVRVGPERCGRHSAGCFLRVRGGLPHAEARGARHGVAVPRGAESHYRPLWEPGWLGVTRLC